MWKVYKQRFSKEYPISHMGNLDLRISASTIAKSIDTSTLRLLQLSKIASFLEQEKKKKKSKYNGVKIQEKMFFFFFLRNQQLTQIYLVCLP